MRWLEVKQTSNISGHVSIPGSKNSSLALLPAAMLTSDKVIIDGIPDIYDVRVIRKIAESIGVEMHLDSGESCVINAANVENAELPIAMTSSFRASYYFVGALLHKCKSVTLGYPGGDNFVDRPIDQHMKVFRSFGAEIIQGHDRYTVIADKLSGCEIYFDMITSGATMNAVLLAVLAEGTTKLRNAATDPEVVDLCNMLNLMGAQIAGAGTDVIRIQGVKKLHGCTYKVIPDRLIASAFLMTVGLTKGTITVHNVIPEHMKSCLYKLQEVGIEIDVKEDSITASCKGIIRATRVRTGMYPIFYTDIQQPMTSLLLMAEGKSIITDPVYPHRFSHVPELNKLGADIKVRSGTALIKGGNMLYGGIVHATDVRAGTCLIMAGLAAEGVTRITGIEHVERGYADIVRLYESAGISIRKCEGDLHRTIADDCEFTPTA
ncbi:UDP-N-acetylglucosamine 1-carboxyvinyltransferase [Paenibacillus albiflavus]|uniref:UDP-N-acetylglucosamine 1-carboxyvinyltransferase n=1 Tax=Paenibacillus albiflavus TaxID=2545760 RepID=A0A4R4E3E9_9BACL|nr:UDP-N-acetylglucosamine 1-carboxyvinyltransferase [Paenibacillus albiflavus]TCZ74026.1 UDP-N-acetylglucosamine 1-carboxyvinyltransferase [Paenibacillus albiflavus]